MKKASVIFVAVFSLCLFAASAFAATGSGSAGALSTSEGTASSNQSGVAVVDPNQPPGAIIVEGNTSEAIQRALYAARDANGTSSNPAVVWIPKGTYVIDRGLTIFSNTRLVLHKEAVITNSIKNPFNSLLFENTASKNVSYNGVTNVTIEGGIWDALDGSTGRKSTIISCRHSNNITFKNMVLQGSSNHMLNISASRNVTIENCVFRNAVKPKNASTTMINSIEAIHMDFANEAGEPGGAIIYDGTPAGDVLVKNCLFDNVFAAVGTHHTIAEGNNLAKQKGATLSWKYNGSTLVVDGCEFKNVRGRAVNAFSMKSVLIRGCEVTGTVRPEYFVRLSDSNDVRIEKCKVIAPIWAAEKSKLTLIGPSVINAAAITGISIDGKSTATINGAIVNNSKGNGIRVAGSSKATIKNCIVNKAKKHGIVIEGTKNCIVTESVVKNSGSFGILVSNTKGANTVKNNYVLNSKDHGIAVSKAPKTAVVANYSASTKGVGSKYDIMISKGSKSSSIKNNIVGFRKKGSLGYWSDPKNKIKASGNQQYGPAVVKALVKIKESSIKGTSTKLKDITASYSIAGLKTVCVVSAPNAKITLKIGKETITKKTGKNGLVVFKTKKAYKKNTKYKVSCSSSGSSVTKSFRVSKA